MSFFARLLPDRVGVPTPLCRCIVVLFVFSRKSINRCSFHSERCPSYAHRSSDTNPPRSVPVLRCWYKACPSCPTLSFVADNILRGLTFLHPASSFRHLFFMSSACFLPSKHPEKCKFSLFPPIFPVSKPPKRRFRPFFKYFLHVSHIPSIFLVCLEWKKIPL